MLVVLEGGADSGVEAAALAISWSRRTARERGESLSARADEPGVVIVFECGSVEECKRYTDDFPLTKAGMVEWEFIPLHVPLPIEALFRNDVDVSEPYDRTVRRTAAAGRK